MGEMSGARPVLRYGGQRGHTLIPAKVGPSADRTPIQNQQNPRHSRGRGNPESIKHACPPIPATIAKPPSFPRTERPSRINNAPSFPRPSLVIPADAGTQNQ